MKHERRRLPQVRTGHSHSALPPLISLALVVGDGRRAVGPRPSSLRWLDARSWPREAGDAPPPRAPRPGTPPCPPPRCVRNGVGGLVSTAGRWQRQQHEQAEHEHPDGRAGVGQYGRRRPHRSGEMDGPGAGSSWRAAKTIYRHHQEGGMNTEGKGGQARRQSESAAMGMGVALREGDGWCCENRVDVGTHAGKEGRGSVVGRRGGRTTGAGRTRDASWTAPEWEGWRVVGPGGTPGGVGWVWVKKVWRFWQKYLQFAIFFTS
jgi:hypothetical protein